MLSSTAKEAQNPNTPANLVNLTGSIMPRSEDEVLLDSTRGYPDHPRGVQRPVWQAFFYHCTITLAPS